MGAPFRMPIDAIQPTQLYVDAVRLARLDGVDLEGLEPIPIRRIGHLLVFTDGHTRALAAHLREALELTVCWETRELDWDACRTRAEWCRQEGIRTIAGLAGRIVPPAQFERLWLQRCRDL